MPAGCGEIAFRLITFLLHFVSAVFLVRVALACKTTITVGAFTESVTDDAGFVVLMNATCTDADTRECFFGSPQAYDVRQSELQWNVWALLAAFEWLSASFALFYLDSVFTSTHWNYKYRLIPVACWTWDLAGILLFMPFSIPMTLLQSALTTLSLLASLIVQCAEEVQSGIELDLTRQGASATAAGETQPAPAAAAAGETQGDTDDEPERVYFYADCNSWDVCVNGVDTVSVVQHRGRAWRIPRNPAQPTANQQQQQQQQQQSEHRDAASAPPPLPPPPPSQSRVTMHYTEYCSSAALLYLAVLVLFVVDPLSWTTVVGYTCILLCNLTGIMAHQCKIDQHRKCKTAWYNLDWIQDGNHFKLFMLHSWSALAVAIAIVIYTGYQDLTSPDVPAWVRFILWNLLVTYCMFGILASVCYALMGTRADQPRFDRWITRLDYGLSVLSLAAKLPIAFTVFYGLAMEPGGGSVRRPAEGQGPPPQQGMRQSVSRG